MSDDSKGKRRLRKPGTPKPQENAPPEGAAGRTKGSGDLRDRIALLVAAAIIIPLVVFTFITFRRSDEPGHELSAPTTTGSAAGPRAAIVDHLALTQPNPTFTKTATELLEQAGYAVDYYPGEEVTVDFYRHLPGRGYRLLILRNHSSLVGTGVEVTEDAGLYTSEPYSENGHLAEQLDERLLIARYYEGGPAYFAIAPEFVRSSMKGKFDDTTIILMGCDGLRTDMLAQALVQRGAKSVVGWSRPVSASHTDAATERLLQHLLKDGLALQEAVAQTMTELGPDPSYDSVLRLYPSEEPASATP